MPCVAPTHCLFSTTYQALALFHCRDSLLEGCRQVCCMTSQSGDKVIYCLIVTITKKLNCISEKILFYVTQKARTIKP